MIKGTKCDFCDEEIYHEGIVLDYEGQRFYFHDEECLQEWLEEQLGPYIYRDDVMEEY